jgi:alkanesulfonate monooxygenase SsuD/methylene tetrahydromethanopterin reductase-like flavin-dependent oxidoreductase (luciferase family)
MKEAGKAPNPFQAGIVQFVGVADSFDEALKLYSEPATYFFNNILHVNPRWTVAPGYITEATARAGIASQVQAAANRSVASQAQADTRHLDFREMVEKGFVIIGEPDQVAEKLRDVAISQNVGNILAMAQFGNMNSELARYNMKRIAQEVKPQIQGIFEKEWEHPNWPKPVSAAPRGADRR